MTLHDSLYDQLVVDLDVPVFVGVAPAKAALPYVVIASDTRGDGLAPRDRQSAPTDATVTVRAYDSADSAARRLSADVAASMTGDALVSRLRAGGVASYVEPSLDLDATGPDQDLASDDPLASRIVRARYTLR